jgi:chaperonin GroES
MVAKPTAEAEYKVNPIRDLVVAVKDEPAQQTSGGVFIPTASQQKPIMANVVAVGPDVKEIKIGDRIVYKEYSTTDLKLGDKEYLIIKEADVLGTI